MTKHVTVKFVFDEMTEDEDTYLDFREMYVVETNTTHGERSSIAEHWAQSDAYWVGISNDLLTTIGGNDD